MCYLRCCCLLGYFGYGGTGKQVRDILHIHDLFDLIDFQIHNMNIVNGQTMNAGGGMDISISLQELTQICEMVTGNRIQIDAVIEIITSVSLCSFQLPLREWLQLECSVCIFYIVTQRN